MPLHAKETLIYVKDKLRTIEKRNKPKNGYVSATFDDLFWFVASKNGTLWTIEQQEQCFNTKNNRSIGPYEISYRMAKGFSLDITNTTKSPDIPENGADVKDAKKIRFGVDAQKALTKFQIVMFGKLARIFGDYKVYDQLHAHPCGRLMNYPDMVSHGISQTTLAFLHNDTNEIGKAIAEEFQHFFVKPLCFVKHKLIVAGSKDGYLEIPSSEFDEAFQCTGTSKGEPMYTLSRKYLEVKAELFSEQVPDSNSIDADWQTVDETINVIAAEPFPHHGTTDVDRFST